MENILVVWYYSRKDTATIFTKLRLHFNLTFIYYDYKQVDDTDFLFNRIYWRDFRSASHLLNSVKPDKVVFMGIADLNTIALNIECKKKNIKTYILQHGILHSRDFYSQISKRQTRKKENKQLFKKIWAKYFSYRFLLISLLKTSITQSIKTILFLRTVRRKGEKYGLEKHGNLKTKKPDFIICFTEWNAKIYKERDKIAVRNFIPIGNPFLEVAGFPGLIDNPSDLNLKGSYCLLIDTAILETSRYDGSYEEVVDFYNQALKFSLKNNLYLVIKRHPKSYKSKRIISHKNIIILDETKNILTLINNAKVVIAFNSSLTIPALYLKPTCLVELNKYELTTLIRENKLALVKSIKNFQLKLDEFIFPNESTKDKIEELFLFKLDGNSLNRLIDVLKK